MEKFLKKKIVEKKVFIQIHHKKSIWPTFEHVFKNRCFEHPVGVVLLYEKPLIHPLMTAKIAG